MLGEIANESCTCWQGTGGKICSLSTYLIELTGTINRSVRFSAYQVEVEVILLRSGRNSPQIILSIYIALGSTNRSQVSATKLPCLCWYNIIVAIRGSIYQSDNPSPCQGPAEGSTAPH